MRATPRCSPPGCAGAGSPARCSPSAGPTPCPPTATSTCSAAARTPPRSWPASGCATPSACAAPSTAARRPWPSARACRSSAPRSPPRTAPGWRGWAPSTSRPGPGAGRAGSATSSRSRCSTDSTALLEGFENHGGITELGPDAAPLARLRDPGRGPVGAGNGTGDRLEGAVSDRGRGTVVGTYLHGPVLARNPALADLLLTRALGELPPLEVPDGIPATTAARLRTPRPPEHELRTGARRRAGA